MSTDRTSGPTKAWSRKDRLRSRRRRSLAAISAAARMVRRTVRR